ncbi:hypothetical protein PLICRDRAFT_611967 [Plicaturopsis crispa FD-325 SS-3]|nr:hypothetical protein PLICRDRAFT_611967 [Plicaturopsis crispa FD-325 SS-3]
MVLASAVGFRLLGISPFCRASRSLVGHLAISFNRLTVFVAPVVRGIPTYTSHLLCPQTFTCLPRARCSILRVFNAPLCACAGTYRSVYLSCAGGVGLEGAVSVWCACVTLFSSRAAPPSPKCPSPCRRPSLLQPRAPCTLYRHFVARCVDIFVTGCYTLTLTPRFLIVCVVCVRTRCIRTR